jgi:Vitamin K-dependent gamma-carboxylase
MILLKKIGSSIENFFFDKRTEWDSILFFRISVGLITLQHFIATIKDFDALFSSHGIIPSDIMNVFTPKWILTLSTIVNYFQALGFLEKDILNTFQYLYLALCLFIILGFYSRISSLVLLIMHVALIKGSSFFIYGADFFIGMSLFYIALLPSDNYFSVRNLYSKDVKVSKEDTYSIKRMFQVHLSIAYFFSGFDKLLGVNWHNGESIWKAINLPYANSDYFFDFSWLAQHSYILVFLGWATIIIETCYPIFIWINKTRRVWLFLIISFHVGIALVLNLYYFSAIMIVWNLSGFYFEEKKILAI